MLAFINIVSLAAKELTVADCQAHIFAPLLAETYKLTGKNPSQLINIIAAGSLFRKHKWNDIQKLIHSE